MQKLQLSSRRTPFAVLFLALLSVLSTSVIADDVTFDESWELNGGTEVRDSTLHIISGRAIHRDTRLQDGTIELDMQLTGKRSFVYLQFRMAADHEYEEIYFRAHKSLAPDGIQYTPVFNGISNWQLYHGPSYTAPTDLPAGMWIHLRLELQGRWAALFVGDGDEPDLVIPLVQDTREGYVALRGFVPGGSTAPFSVRYRNLEVAPGKITYDFSKARSPAPPPPGIVTSWEVSPTFVPEAGQPIEAIPADAAGREWETLATEESGLLLMSRYRGRPAEGRQWAMLARTTLTADEAKTQRVELGYSDAISVFLNGRLLFIADDSYFYDQPRLQGLIGLHQAALYLPLQQGNNELVLAVADRFGGWGLMARVPK